MSSRQMQRKKQGVSKPASACFEKRVIMRATSQELFVTNRQTQANACDRSSVMFARHLAVERATWERGEFAQEWLGRMKIGSHAA